MLEPLPIPGKLYKLKEIYNFVSFYEVQKSDNDYFKFLKEDQSSHVYNNFIFIGLKKVWYGSDTTPLTSVWFTSNKYLITNTTKKNIFELIQVE